MKLIHLSDLHLGKRLKGYSLIEDQKYILDEILEIIQQQNADCILIAGDVYDKNVPSAEAIELFDDFLTSLKNLNLPVFIISGNHDSGERLSFGSRILDKERIYFAGVYKGELKKITLEDSYGSVNFYLCPFLKPGNVRNFFPDENIETYEDGLKTVIDHTEINENQRNVIIAHQFVTGAELCDSEEINVGTLDNVSAEIFDKFDYTALGHIHGPQTLKGGKIRYCGTPLKYSFSEVNHKKSVTVINLEQKGNLSLETVDLKPLHDMVEIKGKYSEIISRDFYKNLNTDDYFHITLTDEEDIPFVAEKLSSVYHNLMAVDYDNTRTKTMYEIDNTEAEEDKSPLEIIYQLYTLYNGREMNYIQQKYITGLIDEIWGEEK